jgi:hypothetical protein
MSPFLFFFMFFFFCFLLLFVPDSLSVPGISLRLWSLLGLWTSCHPAGHNVNHLVVVKFPNFHRILYLEDPAWFVCFMFFLKKTVCSGWRACVRPETTPSFRFLPCSCERCNQAALEGTIFFFSRKTLSQPNPSSKFWSRCRVFGLHSRDRLTTWGTPSASAHKTAEKQLRDENGNSGSDNRRL